MFESPIGPIYVAHDGEIVRRISFLPICPPDGIPHTSLWRFFEDYFYRRKWGIFESIDWSIIPHGHRRILRFLQTTVPFGRTITYGELYPPSPRLAGQALRRNPYPIVIPCHRVVSRKGIGGFTPRIELKVKLLEHEGIRIG